VPLIELHDIHKTYHLGQIDVPVLRGVSLAIDRGEFVALMGASGSGKTTLLNLLGCLDRPTSGSYRFDGQEITRLSSRNRASMRSRRIGFVFQDFNLLARANALENVLMPMAYSPGNASQRELRTHCRGLLEGMGLADRLHHEPSQLSGGQQQRVAIARALVNRPALLLADEPTGNLDSATSREILQMFRRLNTEEGITVVLVTHDPTVADWADRVIHIADGQIRKDEKSTSEPDDRAQRPAPPSTARPRRSPLARLRAIDNTVQIALGSLRRNILRSALTMLGIIIGVAAVIAMMEISRGASTGIQQTVSSMGVNTLLVLPGAVTRTGVSQGIGTAPSLTEQDAEAIQRECPAVRVVAPIVRVHAQVVYGNRNWIPLYLLGTTPAFLEARRWTALDLGEPFTDAQVRKGAKVCLIGQTVARELFGSASPIGKEIRVRNVPFRVVGLLSRKGANLLGVDQDDLLLAPWTTIKYRVSGERLPATSASLAESSPRSLYPDRTPHQLKNASRPVRVTSIDQILVQAVSAEAVQTATDQINALLLQRHHLGPDEPSDFRISDMAEAARAFQTVVRLLSGLLLAVAVISLIVGGVGIMNIMLVSVTERTREIGLRMAVGATADDIHRQFLIEAITLCLIGGLVGILVGRAASLVVRHVLHWPTEASLAAAVTAVAVSVIVGIVFGYYPAWKASRLNPIEALRHE
jgi:macrolide transport system ATP-binding/permease protein